jgi:rRNA maturation RNase YbeY
LVKNLKVNSVDKTLDKFLFHQLISLLKKDFDFNIESLLINFVTSEYLLKINKEFLRHNYLTDIITFDYSKKKMLFDAELYISLHDASRNAKKYRKSLEQELMRLVIHGVLHLLGYDDKSPQKKVVMKEMENWLTNKYMFLLG